jgi:hypothetical protein
MEQIEIKHDLRHEPVEVELGVSAHDRPLRGLWWSSQQFLERATLSSVRDQREPAPALRRTRSLIEAASLGRS